MGNLLKKGDVFVLEHGQKHAVLMGNSEIEYYPCREKSYLAGKYVVFHVEETGIKGINWEYKVFCLQVKNPGIVISFYQSVQHSPVISKLKVIGHATPGKWDIKYFDKKEPDETWTLKLGAEDIARIFGVPLHLITDTTDEKTGNKKTNDFDYSEIMKDAIDEVVKDAIESAAHRIIKEFREGIKKVIGN